MKIIALTLLCIGLAAKAHGSPGLRAVPAHSQRDLQTIRDWPYAFLVSHAVTEPWCIEAKHGTEDGKNIGISPCNFDAEPEDQQWLIDEDGKIHSKLNPTRCLIVDDGIGVSSGDRILFADCGVVTDYNKFIHNKTTGQLQVMEDTSFCLKQTGNTPQLSDTVRTEKCTDHPCFTFTYKDDHSCPSKNIATNPDVSCCDDNDCSVPATCDRLTYSCKEDQTGRNTCASDADCIPGRQCIDGNCLVPTDRDWPYAFLVSHAVDEPWCLEAKHGTEDGKNIGISPCNFEDEPDEQQWMINEDSKIHSKLDPTRCLIVDDGFDIRSGRNRILFADCGVVTDYNKFIHNKTTGQIQVKADTSFCLKQTGPSPQRSDTIRTEKCTDHQCFTFDYNDAHSCPSKNVATNPDVNCCSDNDCSGGICDRPSYQCLGLSPAIGKSTTTCTTDADCKAGFQCVNGSCVTAAPPAFNPVFLVNRDDSAGTDWCVDASFGIGDFEEVGYELCDFTNKPVRQLWHMESDGTIRSDLDKTRCLVVGPEHDLFGGLKVHIASCALREFDYDTATGHIRLRGDNSYCLTPVGPPGGELICAKTCQDQNKFKFDKQ